MSWCYTWDVPGGEPVKCPYRDSSLLDGLSIDSGKGESPPENEYGSLSPPRDQWIKRPMARPTTQRSDSIYYWANSSPPQNNFNRISSQYQVVASERELTRKRIQLDLLKFLRDPIHGVWVAIDSKDELLVHALVMGPDETPYEKGFFYFTFKYSATSSVADPVITCKTTSGGRVTFAHWIHRASGMVSLPSANSSQTGSSSFSSYGSTKSDNSDEGPISLRTLLLKIQKAMQIESTFSIVESWFIEHEKLRVAVIDMVEGGVDTQGMPNTLREAMVEAFYDLYLPWYIKMAREKLQLDGGIMYDPFTQQNSRFKYKTLLARLSRLQASQSRLNNTGPIPIG